MGMLYKVGRECSRNLFVESAELFAIVRVVWSLFWVYIGFAGAWRVWCRCML